MNDYSRFDVISTPMPSKDCNNHPIDTTFLLARKPSKSIFEQTTMTPMDIIERLNQLVTFKLTPNVADELSHWLAVFSINHPEMFRYWATDLLAKLPEDERAQWEQLIYGFELAPSMTTVLMRETLQKSWRDAMEELKAPLPVK